MFGEERAGTSWPRSYLRKRSDAPMNTSTVIEASTGFLQQRQGPSRSLCMRFRKRRAARVGSSTVNATSVDRNGNLRPRRTGCYIEPMITGPLIAEIAGLVGEPARATMLSALLDGRALTASELAYAARVTRQTASTHLAKLAEAGLVAPIRDGRYRYFRLASPRVAEMLDGIMAVALEHRPRYRPLSRQARELHAARICYDHLAGRLSVDLTDSLITHEYIVVVGDEAAEITPAGTRFLTEFGIDLSALSSQRHFCRLCLDWTERRPHIAGAVGAALTQRCFDLGWTERMKHSHAVIVTTSGEHGFLETFGIGVPEGTRNGRRGQ